LNDSEDKGKQEIEGNPACRNDRFTRRCRVSGKQGSLVVSHRGKREQPSSYGDARP